MSYADLSCGSSSRADTRGRRHRCAHRYVQALGGATSRSPEAGEARAGELLGREPKNAMGDPRTGSARPRVQFSRRDLRFPRDSRNPEWGPHCVQQRAPRLASPPRRSPSEGPLQAGPPSARPLLATWGTAARLPPQRPTLWAGVGCLF